MSEQRNKEKIVNDLTEADFAALAKVAQAGAEVFKRMKAAAEENTPAKLKGTFLETQAYNHALEARLVRTSRDLNVSRNRWYVELIQENRVLKEESEKNADLKKRLSEAKEKAKSYKEKADNLSTAAKELELAREDIARLRKVAENDEVKAETQISELEKDNQKLRNDSVQMAVDGFTLCLNQALVMKPNLRSEFMQLTYKFVEGKIIRGKDEEVVFPPPELLEEQVNKAEEAEEDEADDAEEINSEEL